MTRKIFAVVPAYNEAKTIRSVVAQVKAQGPAAVVVDDGSVDQTGRLAQVAGAQVLTHLVNLGQGAALQTGILFVLSQGAEIIVTFDADGQLRAEEISRLVEPLLLGQADVVLGSRFLGPGRQSVPFFRQWVLKLAVAVTRAYTGLKITDTHNGFRAFSRAAAQAISISQNGMAHASEIIEQIKKHHLKFTEVPVTVSYTKHSLQKGQKISDSFKIIWDLVFSRLSK